MAHLYPVNLNLTGKKCMVVGGGKVAERKAATLLEHGAIIRLVSPEASENIRIWSEQGMIVWRRKLFQPEDLDSLFLVFIATGDTDINKEITALCHERGILVNAVDDPQNCDFYVPSILRRNSLCLAISTEGKSPLLAAKIRRELEEKIPEEYGEWVEILGRLRKRIRETDLDIDQRRKLLEAVVYSDGLELLKAGRREKVEERIEQCMSCLRE
jgi:precorrin-2 dehydrogenase/sirohydrochlorin ferrochelatase